MNMHCWHWAALKPFAYLPFKHRRIAVPRLRQGLLCRRNGQWYPTGSGLGTFGPYDPLTHVPFGTNFGRQRTAHDLPPPAISCAIEFKSQPSAPKQRQAVQLGRRAWVKMARLASRPRAVASNSQRSRRTVSHASEAPPQSAPRRNLRDLRQRRRHHIVARPAFE